ncbi:ParB N-terminal domain-containing protein [Nocardia sp. NPDC046763]|uniref:ParB/RepB/Spo0J family partition protein n=1 Tax=Nocardia sp. NPDC046763 TaxID=3155256 RepID=UPI0033D7FA83
MDSFDCRVVAKIDNVLDCDKIVAEIDRLASILPVKVPTAALKYADSPRLGGENANHIATLSESETQLPPIIVHRGSMRVIDGMHRLRVAEMRGVGDIEVVFFEGTESEAFAIGVRTNVSHGLPLSAVDRRSAAKRMLEMHPSWSDRSLAELTGLSAKTIASIRRTSDVPAADSSTRLGRDGKSRPVNSAAGRIRASRLIKEKPHASLREIAREAGVSPATARDVRERMDRGEDPVPSRSRRSPTTIEWSVDRIQLIDDLLHVLQRDPALRSTDSGRAVLRFLNSQRMEAKDWEKLYACVPPHCAEKVSRIARELAFCWISLADVLTDPG